MWLEVPKTQCFRAGREMPRGLGAPVLCWELCKDTGHDFFLCPSPGSQLMRSQC